MPAPIREEPYVNHRSAILPAKGIVGHYNDLEVDALLENYASKQELQQALVDAATGGTVDLSAYATQQDVTDGLALKADLSNSQQTVVAAALKAGIVYLRTDADRAALGVIRTESGGFRPIFVDDFQVGPQEIVLRPDLNGLATEQFVTETVAAAVTGGTVDLSDYATSAYVDQTKAEILTAATTAFQERYTKQEVDGLFVKQADLVAPPNLDGYATEQYVDDSIARIPPADLSAYAKLTDATQVVTAQRFEGKGVVFQQFLGGASKGTLGLADLNNGNGLRLGVSLDGKEPTQLAWVKDLGAYAEKADTYTKAEVDAKIPAGGGSVDLSAYAKLDDASQAIVCNAITADRFFLQPDKSIILLVSGGSERPVFRSGTKSFALAFTQELQGLAKITDLDQVLTTKSIIAQGFAFDQQNVIKIHDTGEGYGPRVSFIKAVGNDVEVDPFVLKSDLGSLDTELQNLTSDVQRLTNEVENAVRGEWKNIPLLPGWTIASNRTPQYRIVGDSIEFRGEVTTAALLDTDTYNNFGTIPAADRIPATTSTLIPSGGGPTGAFATFYVRNDGILQVSPRVVKASGFNLNSRLQGVK